METVLITTDFSDTAHNAALYAFSLLGDLPKRYLLLHSYASPQAGASLSVSINDMMERESERSMEKELEQISALENAPNVPVEGVVVHGDLEVAISKIAAQQNISLVVMGTTGESGYHHKLLGSNASYLVAQLKMPILAVPHMARFEKLHKVTLAVDSDGVSPKTDLSTLTRLLDWTGASLSIIHVQTSPEETKPPLAWLEDRPHSYTNFTGEHVSHELDEAIKKSNSEVLVVIRKGRGFFQRIFKHSVSKALTLQTSVPILVLHEDR